MYKEKFAALFSQLHTDKEIRVHTALLAPPLAAAVLDSLQQAYQLPEDIMKLYADMNGCQLRYTFRDNSDFEKQKPRHFDTGFPPLWPLENYWSLDGCINLLPLDYLLTHDWKDYTWFEGAYTRPLTYANETLTQLEFDKRVKPLDIYSKDEIAVYYPLPGKTDILLGTDHNASYLDYEAISLETYINGLIETRGIIDERTGFFKPRRRH